jgi:hypothetical protein
MRLKNAYAGPRFSRPMSSAHSGKMSLMMRYDGQALCRRKCATIGPRKMVGEYQMTPSYFAGATGDCARRRRML